MFNQSALTNGTLKLFYGVGWAARYMKLKAHCEFFTQLLVSHNIVNIFCCRLCLCGIYMDYTWVGQEYRRRVLSLAIQNIINSKDRKIPLNTTRKFEFWWLNSKLYKNVAFYIWLDYEWMIMSPFILCKLQN